MTHHKIRFGYKASAEQFGPRDLVEYAVAAEQAGLDSVAVSDHFQPWRHSTGHAPYSLAWLAAVGERTKHITLGTSVLTPTYRYHPSIVAQAFATLACLNPDRIFLGIGGGEAMNERPALGIEWPRFKERSARLAEAVELVRRLWTGERVTFDGEFYTTLLATIYDRPTESVPIYLAASGPKAAKLAGGIGDGFICTSGKERSLYGQLLESLEEGADSAGRNVEHIDKMIEIKLSYDHDLKHATRSCEWWAALALPTGDKSGVEDPLKLERLADENVSRAHTRFIVSDDPDEVVERVDEYVNLGFSNLIFHFPANEQTRALEQFASDVLPRMRKRWSDPSPENE